MSCNRTWELVTLILEEMLEGFMVWIECAVKTAALILVKLIRCQFNKNCNQFESLQEDRLHGSKSSKRNRKGREDKTQLRSSQDQKSMEDGSLLSTPLPQSDNLETKHAQLSLQASLASLQLSKYL